MITKKIKTFEEFKNELESDPQLQAKFKLDPNAAIQEFQQESPLETDVWIYRFVVIGLTFVILSITIGVIFLIGEDEISNDKDVPTILTAIGSGAVGALAGLLAPSPKSK